MKSSPKRQAGVTLVEVILAVGIIAIITIFTLVKYQSSKAEQDIDNATLAAQTIATIIKNMYATKRQDDPTSANTHDTLPDYQGLTELVVSTYGGTSPLIKSSTAGQLRHSWSEGSTAVTIGLDPTATPSSSRFAITFAGVPNDGCIGVVGKSLNSFTRITVNGSIVSNTSGAGRFCTQGNNTIQFFAG